MPFRQSMQIGNIGYCLRHVKFHHQGFCSITCFGIGSQKSVEFKVCFFFSSVVVKLPQPALCHFSKALNNKIQNIYQKILVF